MSAAIDALARISLRPRPCMLDIHRGDVPLYPARDEYSTIVVLSASSHSRLLSLMPQFHVHLGSKRHFWCVTGIGC
jgi:hypothetical protein